MVYVLKTHTTVFTIYFLSLQQKIELHLKKLQKEWHWDAILWNISEQTSQKKKLKKKT